jgi:hypothetical protein
MAMRTYGEIDNVFFRRQGFDIYSHGIKYKLIGYDGNKFVSVNSMKELKEEIDKFNTESNNG